MNEFRICLALDLTFGFVFLGLAIGYYRLEFDLKAGDMGLISALLFQVAYLRWKLQKERTSMFKNEAGES